MAGRCNRRLRTLVRHMQPRPAIPARVAARAIDEEHPAPPPPASLSPRILSARGESVSGAAPLTAAERRRFRASGYLVRTGLLDSVALAAARDFVWSDTGLLQ